MAKKNNETTSPVGAGEVDKDQLLKQEAEAKAKQEAEEKAKQEAEAKAKQEAEEKAKQEAEAKAKQEAEKKDYHEYNGRKYTFTKSMPERVNIDGNILSKKEIMSNPDVMESMIDSQNIFITEV